MKEYDVKITETLEKTVTVEAKSRADAEDQVRSAYYNSEYILDLSLIHILMILLQRKVMNLTG